MSIRPAGNDTHSGWRTGEFFGMPAIGRSFCYPPVHLIRFDGGKATRAVGGPRRRIAARQLAGAAVDP